MDSLLTIKVYWFVTQAAQREREEKNGGGNLLMKLSPMFANKKLILDESTAQTVPHETYPTSDCLVCVLLY